MGLLLRLALLALIAWMAYRLLQRVLGVKVTVNREVADSDGNPQVMRRCAWCKVHIPEGESTRSQGHFFCCEAHRDAFLGGKH